MASLRARRTTVGGFVGATHRRSCYSERTSTRCGGFGGQYWSSKIEPAGPAIFVQTTAGFIASTSLGISPCTTAIVPEISSAIFDQPQFALGTVCRQQWEDIRPVKRCSFSAGSPRTASRPTPTTSSQLTSPARCYTPTHCITTRHTASILCIAPLHAEYSLAAHQCRPRASDESKLTRNKPVHAALNLYPLRPCLASGHKRVHSTRRPGLPSTHTLHDR